MEDAMSEMNAFEPEIMAFACQHCTPQGFAIHGEYAVACEGLGSNNAA